MATLSGNITASQRNIRVTDGAAVTPSLRLRVDDELIDFIRFEPYPYINGVRQKGLDPTRWVVTRGVGDSVPASHLSGATVTAAVAAAVSSETLTPPDPFADGTGSAGVTVDNQSDPPAEVTTIIAPGADMSTPGTADMSSLQGVQTIRLLGPFRIEHDTANIGDVGGVTLTTIPAGALVMAYHVEVPETWDVNADTAVLSLFTDFHQGAGPFFLGANWAPGIAQVGTLHKFATVDGLDVLSNNLTLRFTSAGALKAKVTNGGSATTGIADIYVLTAEPSA